jgi:peptide/nickel transport system substrate-binding protein
MRPLGWGPFSIEEWVPGGGIIMERNPFYFRKPEGLPQVGELTFRFIPDPEERAQRLLAGTCDIVTHEASGGLDLEELAASPAVETMVTEDDSWELLAFGISPAAEYARPDFFEDVRVRRGIAQCIDRKAIAQALLGRDAPVLNSYLPPEHPLHAGEELSSWPYDPEAGRAMLAQAGWYDGDGDGIREAHGIPGIADGTPFQVSYKTTDVGHRLRTATRVQAQLEACGIRVAVRALAPEVLFAPGPEGELFGRQFDLAQFAWEATAEPLCEAFLSSQIPGAGDWAKPNVAGWIDNGYDVACREALRTLPGTESYATRHAAPQRIFSERAPVLPLYYLQKTTVARSSVRGLAPNPSQWSELWNVELMDVEQ